MQPWWRERLSAVLRFLPVWGRARRRQALLQEELDLTCARLQAVRAELEQACRSLAARVDRPGAALTHSPHAEALLRRARPRRHRESD